MSISGIFRHCMTGKAEDIPLIQEILRADPTQLNATLSLPLPDSDKSVTLTPIFLAAISASAALVRFLIDAGASLRSEVTGEDLFTWTCLCPFSERLDLLGIIFEKDIRPRIHPNLPDLYLKLFNQDVLSDEDTQALAESKYPLSPFNVTVLNDLPFSIRTDASLVVASSFREMTSLELATYRVAVYKLLNSHSEDFFPTNSDPKLLFLAIQLGDLETVKALAGEREGKELTEFLSAELYNGTTPAYIAARHNRVNILEYLNANNVDLSSALTSGPINGVTPICAAAEQGQIEALQFFRRCGIDLSQPLSTGDRAGWTPATFAVFGGQVKVVVFLKEQGVNLSLPLAFGNNEGRTLIYIAALHGELEVLRHLHQVEGQSLFKPLESGLDKGRTPLYIAAKHKVINAFMYIIGVLDSFNEEERNQFCQPIISEIAKGENLASLTVRKGNIKVLKKLIKDLSGTDWLYYPIVSETGSLPVLAAFEGNVELLECLRLLGFDLSLSDNTGDYLGWTPMYRAASAGKVEAVKYLKEVCKINPFLPLTIGGVNVAPVYIAANRGHTAVLEYVGLGVSEQQFINRFRVKEPGKDKTLSGLHPFHLACLATNVEGVKACYESDLLDPVLDQYSWPFQFWNFVLHYKGPRIGPCDAKEQDQIRIMRFLMEKGYLRYDLMVKIKEMNRPRIYQALSSESETLLERVLLNKNFLMRILSKQLTVSRQRGRILWKQRGVTKEIDPNQIPKVILTTIDSVLSKNEVSKSLLFPIVENFEQILTTATDQFTTSSLSMSDEECRFLCSLLETLEHVSHELAMSQVGGSLDTFSAVSSSSTTEVTRETSRVASFSGGEPPTVTWVSNEESHDFSARKRRRAESLPPIASSTTSAPTGARTPVTGKRKEPGE